MKFEENEGRFIVVNGKKTFLGRVLLTVEKKNSGINIDTKLIEIARYEDWTAGVREGILYALATMNLFSADVQVTRVLGLDTDTNPSILAAAAADAVWRCLEFSPSESQRQLVASVALQSWEQDYKFVPDLQHSPLGPT